MAKMKSLFDEIVDYMIDYKKQVKTDGHFKNGVFGSTRNAVEYAISNMIGHVKAIKEGRYWDKVEKEKRKKRLKK